MDNFFSIMSYFNDVILDNSLIHLRSMPYDYLSEVAFPTGTIVCFYACLSLSVNF